LAIRRLWLRFRRRLARAGLRVAPSARPVMRRPNSFSSALIGSSGWSHSSISSASSIFSNSAANSGVMLSGSGMKWRSLIRLNCTASL
jgi:hypothetical protein